MGNRDMVRIDDIMMEYADLVRKMRHELVTEKIEIDPRVRTSPFLTAENFTVKLSGLA